MCVTVDVHPFFVNLRCKVCPSDVNVSYPLDRTIHTVQHVNVFTQPLTRVVVYV